MTTVTFNIQTLEGKTFSVDLPLELVEKVHHQEAPLRDYYDQYGLDHLKEAICQERGVDPVCQTIIGQRELNINSLLLDYSDLLLTLLVTPSLTVTFRGVLAKETESTSRVYSYYQLEKSMSVDIWEEALEEGEKDSGSNKHECELICYLSLEDTLTEIQVVGRSRDYFKVLFKSLPSAHLKCQRNFLTQEAKDYKIRDTDPEYVWIRYRPEQMEVIG